MDWSILPGCAQLSSFVIPKYLVYSLPGLDGRSRQIQGELFSHCFLYTEKDPRNLTFPPMFAERKQRRMCDMHKRLWWMWWLPFYPVTAMFS